MIPKIIHQTYKNHNLPPIYKDCQETIISLHDDFEYKFYTDDDMFNYIKNNFEEYYQKFIELPRMIMKIDMFRYFLMYKEGGIYSDLDYKFLKKFDFLNEHIILPISRENESNEMTCVGNCIFASEPNNPFWKTVIDTLFTYNRYTKNINDLAVISSTGPVFLTDMYIKYTNKENIKLIPRIYFHPYNTKGFPESYGYHKCTGLWRNNML